MQAHFIRTGAAALLAATMGLAHAQSTTASPGSPPGTIVAPGVTATPGAPPSTLPGVAGTSGSTNPASPSARGGYGTTSPLPGASDAVSPNAGSLSGSVEERNRSRGDTLGAPMGNGTTNNAERYPGVTIPSPSSGTGGSLSTSPGTSPSGGTR